MAEQMVTVLDRENTILNRFIAQMRDVTVQGDSMRFRRNLERAGEIMAYEISKTLEYQPRSVETPLGEAEIMMPDEEIVAKAMADEKIARFLEKQGGTLRKTIVVKNKLVNLIVK